MSKLINIIQDRYSVIPNEVFTDRRLDYRSRGVLCTLLSLPNGWDFSTSGLASLVITDDDRKGDGETAIRSCLQYLERLGYLQRIHVKDDKGYFIGYDYKINIPPILSNHNIL